MSEEQINLFDVDPDWKEHWKEMPEYEHKDLQPEFQLIVSFENYEDLQKFAKLVEQKITRKTPSIWYPELKWEKVIGLKQYTDEEKMKGAVAEPEYKEAQKTLNKSREEMANAAGAAAAKVGNEYGDKKLLEMMDEQMVDLHINQNGELPEMPGELFNTCEECQGTGHVPYEREITCARCGGEGLIHHD